MTSPGRRALREDLRSRIVKEAAALFVDRGYEATTMQSIAARVGVTAAGLYYYFPSKQHLLFEVLETALEALVERAEAGVRAVPDDAPDRPAAALQALIYQHVKFQLEEPEESAVYGAAFYGTHFMLNALSEEQRGRLRELQARTYDMLRQILREGEAAGLFTVREPAATASALIALGEFAPAWFKSGGRLSPNDVASLYADLALRMVTALPGGPPAPATVETVARSP